MKNSRTRRKLQAGFDGIGSRKWVKKSTFGDYRNPKDSYKEDSNSVIVRNTIVQARTITASYSKHLGSKPLSRLKGSIRRQNITTYNEFLKTYKV